jgi:hypothetical protein
MQPVPEVIIARHVKIVSIANIAVRITGNAACVSK